MTNKVHDLFGTFPSIDPEKMSASREKARADALEISKALDTPGGKLILAQLAEVYVLLDHPPEEFIKDGIVDVHRVSEVVGQRAAFQTMISWLKDQQRIVEKAAKEAAANEQKENSV
jgi:hypothetical protein